MPASIESEIKARTEVFVSELIGLIQTSALEVVEGALSGGVLPSRAGRSVALSSSRPKGRKRDPEVIAELTSTLEAFIAKNPGKRIEEIGAALGVPTRELAFSAKKLIAAKLVTTKGQKRATTYYAEGGKAPRAAKSGRAAAAEKPRAKAARPVKTKAKRGKAGKRAAAPKRAPKAKRGAKAKRPKDVALEATEAGGESAPSE